MYTSIQYSIRISLSMCTVLYGGVYVVHPINITHQFRDGGNVHQVEYTLTHSHRERVLRRICFFCAIISHKFHSVQIINRIPDDWKILRARCMWIGTNVRIRNVYTLDISIALLARVHGCYLNVCAQARQYTITASLSHTLDKNEVFPRKHCRVFGYAKAEQISTSDSAHTYHLPWWGNTEQTNERTNGMKECASSGTNPKKNVYTAARNTWTARSSK